MVCKFGNPILNFKPIEQIFFEHCKFQIRLCFQNLYDQKWANHLRFLYLIFLTGNNIQSLNQSLLTVRRTKIPKVCKRLNPKIFRSLRIITLSSIISTEIQHSFLVILLDVVIQQLPPESKKLTAFFDTFRKVIIFK